MTSKPHVLVVDDNPDVLYEVEKHLSNSFDVKCASTLDEARRALTEGANTEEYSVLVTDMRLQEGTEGGLVLARELNEQYEVHPEVVVLTAFPEFENADKCMQARAFGYVVKGSEDTYEVLENKCIEASNLWHRRYQRIPGYLLESPVALLFGEITGAIDFFERIEAHLLERLLAVTRKVTTMHDGYATKPTDGSFRAVFHTVTQALQAALAIRRELAARVFPRLTTPLYLHESIHWGEIQRLRSWEGDDIIGVDALTCARTIEKAAPGQVVITEKALQALKDRETAQIRPLGQHQLRGVNEPIQLYEVLHLAPHNRESETVQSEQAKEDQTAFPEWEQIFLDASKEIAKTGIKLPSDLAEHHDYYAHGKPLK